ncbi:Short C-terminal domain-containing protein [Haloarcula vallismortis]|uniref:Short C-terminal domain-containing protein n=1 Tax=Haloarcula vallismortis TaxID=28442 RepID=A0A1H2ZIK3_HALVA|nr:SHOCT domain-containing protein [Haloarcula vallismortis]SDX16549.1 Short C-terminal domain-containing protein [Haloarcula vallismortis]
MGARIGQPVPENARNRAIVAVSTFVLGAVLLSNWITATGPYFLHPSYVSLATLVSFLLGTGFVLTSIYLIYTLGEYSTTTGRGSFDSEAENASSPIDLLREQYAMGEITDEEFEHRLNTLLQLEDTDQQGQSEAPQYNDSIDSTASSDPTAELNMEQSR